MVSPCRYEKGVPCLMGARLIMRVDMKAGLVLGVCELAALFVIMRLWSRKRRMRVIPRLLWSVVLLIPFFGILFYGFTRSDPEAHSDDVPDSTYGTDGSGH